MHPKHVLEIKDVCQEDSGLYTVVLKNSDAGLERKLNITLVVNGMCVLLCEPPVKIPPDILGTKQECKVIEIPCLPKWGKSNFCRFNLKILQKKGAKE